MIFNGTISKYAFYIYGVTDEPFINISSFNF
nr:MAG TPA: hypothetical protein [Caudoviricetes sp.]